MEQNEITLDEIAPDMYRLSIYMAKWELQFNSFLIGRRTAAVPYRHERYVSSRARSSGRGYEAI